MGQPSRQNRMPSTSTNGGFKQAIERILNNWTAYRLSAMGREAGLMYVSALGTIADISTMPGQTDKALPIWNLSSPAKQPRCVIFHVSREADAWHSGGYPFLTGQYSPPCNIATLGTPEQKTTFCPVRLIHYCFQKLCSIRLLNWSL